MAMTHLGETFDIHTGGVDLAFPHHENEIAQSESATGKPFARFWVHAEHLLVDGQKMSKSLGNFYTLRDLTAKGYPAEAIRYLLCSTSHRKQLNFTLDGLKGAVTAIERLRNFGRRLQAGGFPEGDGEGLRALAAKAVNDFDAGLDDDLNTAQALAAVFDFVRECNIRMDARKFFAGDVAPALGVLEAMDSIFAVLRVSTEGKLPAEEIESLLAERAAARKAKDFARSDEIRDQLAEQGVVIQDGPTGAAWHYAD